MTRSEVEAFLAVVRYGSISTAADRLYITQPALSRRLRNMEAELGYVLFLRDRGMRSITLTEEGQAFLPVAGKLLRAWQEAAEIPSHKKKPVLRLASIGSVSTYLLPPVLRQFLERGGLQPQLPKSPLCRGLCRHRRGRGGPGLDLRLPICPDSTDSTPVAGAFCPVRRARRNGRGLSGKPEPGQ